MSWTQDVLVALHTTLLAQLDAGSSGAAYMTVHDSADVELSRLPFDYPAGAVTSTGTTKGQLVLSFGARDEEAAAGGTIHHCKLYSRAGTVVNDSIPCKVDPPASGYVSFPSLTVVANQPVEATSFTVG